MPPTVPACAAPCFRGRLEASSIGACGATVVLYVRGRLTYFLPPAGAAAARIGLSGDHHTIYLRFVLVRLGVLAGGDGNATHLLFLPGRLILHSLAMVFARFLSLFEGLGG